MALQEVKIRVRSVRCAHLQQNMTIHHNVATHNGAAPAHQHIFSRAGDSGVSFNRIVQAVERSDTLISGALASQTL